MGSIGIGDSKVALVNNGVETTQNLGIWLQNLPPLNIQQTFSGPVSAAVGAPANSLFVADTAKLTSGLHIDGLSIVQNINQGAGVGSRNALFAGLGQNSPLPSTAFFTGIFSVCQSTSGNNGSAGSESGDYYAFGGVTEAFPGATFLHGVKGAEFDTSINAGAGALYHSTLSLVLVNNHAVRGSSFDAALSMTRDNTTTQTWANGIVFGDIFGTWPFATDSTLIGVLGPGTPRHANVGIDFTGVVFTNASISLPGGFSVNPNGICTCIDFAAASHAAPVALGGLFQIYMDSADSKLKAIGPSGTITILALP